jgi:hypothetical protein
VHAHVSQQCSAGPAIGAHTPDDDAIDVEWRIAQPPTGLSAIELAVTEAIVVQPPGVVSEGVSSTRPRGHDPPDLTLKQPRSPPA